MTEVLARCGYRCDLCPAYHDNVSSDADRQRTSDGWHKYFGFRVPGSAGGDGLPGMFPGLPRQQSR